MKITYVTDTYEYKFLCNKKKYVTDNIVKFSLLDKKDIIVKHSYCGDENFLNLFHEKWDIFVFWIDKNKITKSSKELILNEFINKLPLYPIFTQDYLLITKIISKQVFQMSKNCTIQEIAEIYLYEFGGILVKPQLNIYVSKSFLLSEYPVIWSIEKQDLQHIKPKMHGWFSKNTKLLLLYCLKNFNYNNIIELGSWYGLSTSFIIKNMKNNTQLYCFDKFQNIASSPYDFNEKSPIDNFYFTTPRYETFCKNISKYLSNEKKCYTIKYDVNNFVKIMKYRKVIPDIVFIDAIKNSEKLYKMINNLFLNYKNIIIVGDDYIFNSVKETISNFIKNNKDINYYITNDAYILTRYNIDNKSIQDFISKKLKTNNIYDILNNEINKNNYNQIIKILNNNNIDINKKLFNGNTLYTYIIALIYVDKRKELNKIATYIENNYKIKKINNILGLNYKDYMKYNNLYY